MRRTGWCCRRASPACWRRWARRRLLGPAAALFSLGTAGLVSSVAEVNDAATAELMVDLHAALAAGRDPATALHGVREHARGDAVAAGTAAAFLALGV
ncbi:CHAT domain-containing protein [Nocardioides sp. W3-2-3]|uniref:CHAT domain-containing protein n=1 Tax=Nocardioides convexus TaxID=2712224 RepID=UPI00241866E4|nr:CHAT domain-containing protein [Nocardioides convexus]NHA00890.1 CHAT domain-containing protein [Nocardioides convexus]